MEDSSVPDVFPEGTEFFDSEDSPFVLIPSKGLFNAWGGKLRRSSTFGDLGDALEVDEATFRRLIARSQAS